MIYFTYLDKCLNIDIVLKQLQILVNLFLIIWMALYQVEQIHHGRLTFLVNFFEKVVFLHKLQIIIFKNMIESNQNRGIFLMKNNRINQLKC